MTDSDPIALENSLKILQKNLDVFGQLQILTRLGKIYQSKRQYQKSLIYFRQALNLVKNQSNFDYQIIALVNMGCAYWEMSQLKKAMNYFQDALLIIEEPNDSLGKGMLFAIMGVSYWRKGEWSKANQWFENALKNFPAGEIKTDTLQSLDPFKYEGLKIVMEKGIETLKNRIQLAIDQNDPSRVLLPSFSMIPLMFFTGKKEAIPKLMETSVMLAHQQQKHNILDVISTLKKLMKID